MSLKVWLPLCGDLRQQGCSNITVTNNGATVDSTGKIGSCYSFSGNSIYGSLSGINNMTQMSGCCWIYLTNTSTAQYMFHFGGQSSWQCKFSLDYDVDVRSTINGTEYRTGITLNTNTWYHICVTWNGTIAKWYVNGVERVTKTTSGTFSASNNFAIGARTSSTAGNTFAYQITNAGKLNDFRLYDHCLSAAEVHEIGQGLVLHYKLNEAAGFTDLITRNTNVTAYNNHGNTNNPTSVTYLSEQYNGDRIIQYSATPTSNVISSIQTQLYSHGIYNWNKTFKANTKYVFWIYYKPITHLDTRAGGTASNIGGWTEIPPIAVGGGWYRVGQYRNGSVTTDKTDNIFVSYKTPSAVAGQNIIIYFASPHLIEGTTEIPPYDYPSTIIQDSSGYEHNGSLLNAPTISSDTSRYSSCLDFNGTTDGILIENLPFSNIINTEVTYSFWLKPNGENGARSIYFGSYSSTSWSIEKTGGNVLRSYWNGSPDETCSGATITDGVWQHVCITKKGTSDIKVYINGVQKWNSTATHNNLNFPTTFRIGRDTRSNDGTPYKGLMSDFRIYCTALSAADVKQLYELGAKVDNKQNLHAFELIENSPIKITKHGQIKCQELDEISNTKFYKTGIVETNQIIEL